MDPMVADNFVGEWVVPPPLVEVDGEAELMVSSVHDSWVYRKQLQYLICWMGYDALTWEPSMVWDGL